MMTHYRTILVVMMFLCILTAPHVYAADILKQIHPYIRVTGEYSDNLNLTADNQKKDFYTTITPGIRFSNMDAQSGVNLDASAGYVFYNRYDDLNYFTANVNLEARYLTSSHFNFYLRNAFIRSDDPREREYFTVTQDNKFVLATETQRAVFWRNVIEPVVEYQFGPENRIGVRYRNNYYRSEDIANNDSIENYIGPFLTYWFNRQHGISLDYGYTNGYFESDPDLNGHRVGGAYMLRFTPRATASLKGAYTKQTYTDDLLDYEIYETSVGLSYQFSPTLSAAAEVGYYWMEPTIGSKQDGVTFRVDITQLDARTTYRLSMQGGYTQDLFTSQNLGFREYYRATGSITHFLDRRLSVGCTGSVERAESEPDRRDTIWTAGANITYLPLQWLQVSLGYAYQQDDSNYAINEYKENRVMLSFTATY
ncbi:MAG TPA: outer membrane beta-barrel protein [Smithellaceae bacterium]|nr:outer membrane beta-barrel protein [Smithellaceae bacterium]HRY38334.1 outer membrane beta-barrel protein [Smithellaceae bacterium]